MLFVAWAGKQGIVIFLRCLLDICILRHYRDFDKGMKMKGGAVRSPASSHNDPRQITCFIKQSIGLIL